MPAPELIIFDCDGVLVDSEIIAARVRAHMLTKAGHPIDEDEILERYSGMVFRDMLIEVEKHADVPFQASMIDEMQAELEKRLEREIKATEGVRAAISASSIPRAICSNSPSKRIEMMLKKSNLFDLFEGRIYSAVEAPVLRPKPDPDGYVHVARTLGISPENIIVVEDSVHGVHAARGAQMRVLGYTGGSHTQPGHADSLTDAGAETVIARWNDFNATIDAMGQWRA